MTEGDHQRRMYTDLSWTWPIISPPEDYIYEAGFFRKMIQEHSQIDVNTLLDLGCGGGHNDCTLKQSFSVTGVDISENMLAIARQLNPEVSYALGDMRTVRFGKTFDAVMIADSIAYMLTLEDLREALDTVYIHLKPEGVFCTYAEETKERFQQNKTHYSINHKGDIDIVLIQNDYDPDPVDTIYESTFVYLIRNKGSLDIVNDRHLSGLFNLDTWSGEMTAMGFKVIQTVFEGESFPFFICLKS